MISFILHYIFMGVFAFVWSQLLCDENERITIKEDGYNIIILGILAWPYVLGIAIYEYITGEELL